ncbi:3-phosphoshikimate 1-carboxyvinyltransferase [Thermosulfurimonas marina]|uniref:3-phosphoshikimate 1-carboxyvinyltransferase n=1 Tax=Thermosulfurimonas marina TaxID=2047767 RepID=A0A6H1WQ80_9BACT|nr:3-phosphoshikimate 1-carboxyvinyltransferase [Thermosulfurimonas marina]QJA05320.1 3-phosphoshikimate 1-carboxyvinyltransferase [Thermosulfurimonas marina]
MEKKKIKPLAGPVNLSLRLPGSKSLTQRALLCAALAEGESRIENPLLSEDTQLLARALSASGAEVVLEAGGFRVRGGGGSPAFSGQIKIFFGNNGTGSRFFLAYAALARKGRAVLYGKPRLHERPMGTLLEALRSLGAEIRCLEREGFLPVEVRPGRLQGGRVELSAEKSSQFVSALLLLGPYLPGGLEIAIRGELVSTPYVDLTLAVMRAFGVEVERRAEGFKVPEGRYTSRTYEVEGDASSAGYFLILPALLGGKVTVENLSPDSPQADTLLLHLLSEIGGRVEPSGPGVRVEFFGRPRGFEVNLKEAPDLFPTLCVLAAVAEGRSRIYGAPHLRYKECDRIAAMVKELRKCGALVKELPDGVEIEGGRKLHGTEIDTYDDHRIAMAFAVLGLAVPGMIIRHPACVAKSFPEFWEYLQGLYS